MIFNNLNFWQPSALMKPGKSFDDMIFCILEM